MRQVAPFNGQFFRATGWKACATGFIVHIFLWSKFMLKSQGPGGSFIEPGAKRLNRLMVTAQVHPVGKQYYYLSEVQVKPIRDAGEAQVAAAPGGEKAAAAGIPRAGNIEAKGACGPRRGGHKGSDHFRVKKVVSSFPV